MCNDLTARHATQTDRTLHIAFQALKADNTLQVPITEATMDGLNVVSTQIGDAVTGKTLVDPNLPIVLTPEVSGHSWCCLKKLKIYRSTNITVVSLRGG